MMGGMVERLVCLQVETLVVLTFGDWLLLLRIEILVLRELVVAQKPLHEGVTHTHMRH